MNLWFRNPRHNALFTCITYSSPPSLIFHRPSRLVSVLPACLHSVVLRECRPLRLLPRENRVCAWPVNNDLDSTLCASTPCCCA